MAGSSSSSRGPGTASDRLILEAGGPAGKSVRRCCPTGALVREPRLGPAEGVRPIESVLLMYFGERRLAAVVSGGPWSRRLTPLGCPGRPPATSWPPSTRAWLRLRSVGCAHVLQRQSAATPAISFTMDSTGVVAGLRDHPDQDRRTMRERTKAQSSQLASSSSGLAIPVSGSGIGFNLTTSAPAPRGEFAPRTGSSDTRLLLEVRSESPV